MHMTASLLLCPAQIHKSKKGAKVGSPPLELDPCILQHICAFMHLSFRTIICIIGKILNRGTTSSQSSWNVTIFWHLHRNNSKTSCHLPSKTITSWNKNLPIQKYVSNRTVLLKSKKRSMIMARAPHHVPNRKVPCRKACRIHKRQRRVKT